MNTEELLSYLRCPITNLIFRDPVLAEDGEFYELMAIKRHLDKSNISPVTGERMGSTLLKAQTLCKMTKSFLKLHPEYSTEQFLFKKPFHLFTKEFLDLLKNKKYDDLTGYTSIILNTDVGRDTLFGIMCKTCPDDIVKDAIDNSIDYDIHDKNKLKPIHTACKHGSDEIVLYLANKGVDLDSEDANGETPLGYSILYRKDYGKIIHELAKLGANVNKMNKNGSTIGHYVVSNNDLDSLDLLIKYNLNVGIWSAKLGGLNLLQYAFKNAHANIIKYLINLNVCLDIDVDPKTPCEQLIYLNPNLNRKQKQKLVLYYLNKLVNNPSVMNDYVATIKMNGDVMQSFIRAEEPIKDIY